MVASVALQEFSSSRVEFTWVVLAAVVAGGFAWFVVRALVAALVGFERSDVSARYLWLLALEDWPVVVSILASATLFGLTWPDMGVWALLVAGMPYAFSHLAFVRYDSTRVTYGQTIRALAQIPEVAGLAPRGHSTRTAELALAIAREVGLHPKDVAELEYAALMHDVGRITLGEPAILKAGSRSSPRRRTWRESPSSSKASTLPTGGPASNAIPTCPWRRRSSRSPAHTTNRSTRWACLRSRRWSFSIGGRSTNSILWLPRRCGGSWSTAA